VLDNIQVGVRMTVDMMVDGWEDQRELILLFWVKSSELQDEKEDAINQACRECKRLGWTPYLPEHWEVERMITSGHYICKTNGGRIMEIPAPEPV